MSGLFGNDRTTLRRTFALAWQRYQQGLPLEPLQSRIVDVVAEHPEYQQTVQDPQALERDYLTDGEQSNPFLHMAMHLALVEQCATNRPAGISKALARIQSHGLSAHEAQHQAMRCLERAMWEAQSEGRAPDEKAYLKCLQDLKKRKRSQI